MEKYRKYQEPTALNDVAEFHQTFNLPIEEQPIIPSSDRCRLRVNLLEEELRELKAAIQEKNLVEIADALCDLQYVLSGAILEFGLAEKFKSLFDEVQRSNLSKACKTQEEADETLLHYKIQNSTNGTIEQKENHFLVYRLPDHKVLKSISYSPANLKDLL